MLRKWAYFLSFGAMASPLGLVLSCTENDPNDPNNPNPDDPNPEAPENPGHADKPDGSGQEIDSDTIGISLWNDYEFQSWDDDPNKQIGDQEPIAMSSKPNLPEIPLIDKDTEYKSLWDAGSGKKWGTNVYAPFVDYLTSHDSNSTPDLVRYSSHTHAMYYNLGFVNIDTNQAQLKANGALDWAWGGLSSLKEGSEEPQYLAIKKNIKDFRETGGDITISFGGATGMPFWMSDLATKDSLAKAYTEIIQGYGLSRIDLDIEGGGEDVDKNALNAQAIKEVQDATGVEVVLTLPSLTSGLDHKGIAVLDEYLKAGVTISAVNVMAMYLGEGIDYEGILADIDATKGQIQEKWKQWLDEDLTDKAAYQLVGVTPSIGYENDQQVPVLYDDWQKVVDYAAQKQVGILSMWVANRDALDGFYDEKGQQSGPGGIRTKWEYGIYGHEHFADQEASGSEEIADPIQLSNLRGSEIDLFSAKLQWSGREPSGVQTRVYLAEGDEDYKLEKTTSNNQITLNNLEANQSYWVVVASVNSIGKHTFSQPFGFVTPTIPKDNYSPLWYWGQKIKIDTIRSFHNRVLLKFPNGKDFETKIKKYVLRLYDDTFTPRILKVQEKELIVGQDIPETDSSSGRNEDIQATFYNLIPGHKYHVEIACYDLRNNRSAIINKGFSVSEEYPTFDYEKSQAGVYQYQDIVWFESTIKSWVAAGIGPRLYIKSTTWSGKGWAPDTSTYDNQSGGHAPPGVVIKDSTGWSLYTDI